MAITGHPPVCLGQNSDYDEQVSHEGECEDEEKHDTEQHVVVVELQLAVSRHIGLETAVSGKARNGGWRFLEIGWGHEGSNSKRELGHTSR